MKKNIVIVDDDERLADLMRIYLENANYNVVTFLSPVNALEYLIDNIPDILLLDIMMPEIDGIEMLIKLRDKYKYPIILVSARNTNLDVIDGLGKGADDYLKKPFDPSELVARVNAMIRRNEEYSKNSNYTIIYYKDLEIDMDKQMVFKNDKKLDLTQSEYKILKELIKCKGKIISTENLFKLISGDDYYNRECNLVAVHIRNLRLKLNDSFDNHKYIKTSWGVGYYVD